MRFSKAAHRKCYRLTHVLKHQVDVTVIVGLQHVAKTDDVVVARHLLQVHDLAEGALRIGGILEGVEDFLQGHHLLGALVDGFPHDTVRLYGHESQRST